MKRLIILKAAQEELSRELLYYDERSPAAAIQFLADVQKAYHLIQALPKGWPARTSGTRSCKLSRFPHAVIYRETATTLRIIAVAHLKRRYGYWAIRF